MLNFPTASVKSGHPCRVLLVIPGSVNYFYNLYARWMSEALCQLGVQVDLCELSEVPSGTYDLCILSNVAEILHATEDHGGRDYLKALCPSVGTMINFSAECVHSRWFKSNLDLCREFGVEAILDIGFSPQGASIDCQGLAYFFVFDGLLASQASQPTSDPSDRFIPWAHVGAPAQAGRAHRSDD